MRPQGFESLDRRGVWRPLGGIGMGTGTGMGMGMSKGKRPLRFDPCGALSPRISEALQPLKIRRPR